MKSELFLLGKILHNSKLYILKIKHCFHSFLSLLIQWIKCNLYIRYFGLFFFFFFFGHLMVYGVLGPGIRSEPTYANYITAVGKLDP